MRRTLIATIVPLMAFYFGWKMFWFLTDDAFIAFRYISNSILGYGYVWNPPPFEPVEGYTSFLWVLLLESIWRVFGIEPPEAANAVALIFAYLSLTLTAFFVHQMPLRPRLERWRPVFVALVLIGCVTNRTFLAWGSSGLETAMFNFFYLSWVYCMVCSGRFSFSTRGFLIALCTTLLYLTRPDGLLFGAAAALALGVLFYRRAQQGRLQRLHWLSALPLVGIPAHLLWRHAFYGEWLPNSYVAKYIGPRPAAGADYLFSFTLEYVLWLWWLVVVIWAVRKMKQHRESPRTSNEEKWAGVIGIAAIAAHALYYTFIIGGDHFGYRVYSQLIPLIFISLVYMMNALSASPRIAVGYFGLFLLLTLPIPWAHWHFTRMEVTKTFSITMKTPIAHHVPTFARGYLGAFDASQSRLVDAGVCIRHRLHKLFVQHQLAMFPGRDQGSEISLTGYPVYATPAVGVAGWVLPHVSIIDLHGLNDYIIARNQDLRGGIRMAHSRKPPVGYVESFMPNVTVEGASHTVRVAERQFPLTAEGIMDQERMWRTWLTYMKLQEKRAQRNDDGN